MAPACAVVFRVILLDGDALGSDHQQRRTPFAEASAGSPYEGRWSTPHVVSSPRDMAIVRRAGVCNTWSEMSCVRRLAVSTHVAR